MVAGALQEVGKVLAVTFQVAEGALAGAGQAEDGKFMKVDEEQYGEKRSLAYKG